MIDVESEKLIPHSQVPSLSWLPRRRGGASLHPRTVKRWRKAGVRGVKLETVMVGGTPCSSEAALRRFFERLASPDPSAKVPTPSERKVAQSRAKAILARYGI